MQNGWIKLHRKLLENPLTKKPAWAWLWIVLLLHANHEDERMIWNGREITIKSGSFLTGRKVLAEASRVPESTIEDILKYLERQHQIQQQKTTKYRVITILNWNEYQNPTAKATTEQQQSNTNNNVENDKKTIRAAARDPLKVKTTIMKRNAFNYSEERHTDSHDDVIDIDTNEKKIVIKSDAAAAMRKIIDWAAKRRGGVFLNLKKQYKALAILRAAGKSPKQVQDRWEEMERDKFWAEKGFDFMTLVNSFDKKP